jgi:[CysO sulfur-carrier protein]-S-L-cysteine hydrolase
MKIELEDSLYLVMLAHAQALYPQEACGLLAGRNGRISHLYVIENILRSPTAYEMNGRQQLAAMLHVEKLGLELLAGYHSHPNGPSTPSKTDIAQAYYPDLIQLIISLQERSQPSVGAFTIIDGQVKRCSISVFGQ